MNDLERKLRQLLEGHEESDAEQEEQGVDTFNPNSTLALNDDAGLARALGAHTLNGNPI